MEFIWELVYEIGGFCENLVISPTKIGMVTPWEGQGRGIEWVA